MIIAPITGIQPDTGYPTPPWQRLLEQVADGNAKSAADELAALDALWEEASPEETPAALLSLPEAGEADAAPARLLAGGVDFPAQLFSRVGVCLHLVPETVQDPFELERFSLAISSLERGWWQWQASGSPGEWFALSPQWPKSGQATPSWSLVEHPGDFHAAARLIVLNTEAVSYDQVIGLEMTPGSAYQSERLVAQHTSWAPFDQHIEHFEEHATRTLRAFEQLASWYRYPLRHLAVRWQISFVELEQWLRLCILWHDAGKLTAAWQHAAARWQAEGVRRPIQQGVMARVDFRFQRDGAFPCPEHGPLTGCVLARGLAVVLGATPALLNGTLLALSHHHGLCKPDEEDLTPHPEAWATLMALAEGVLDARLCGAWSTPGGRYARAGWRRSARPPHDPDTWMAYSLLVRAIRLADREVALEEVLS